MPEVTRIAYKIYISVKIYTVNSEAYHVRSHQNYLQSLYFS